MNKIGYIAAALFVAAVWFGLCYLISWLVIIEFLSEGEEFRNPGDLAWLASWVLFLGGIFISAARRVFGGKGSGGIKTDGFGMSESSGTGVYGAAMHGTEGRRHRTALFLGLVRYLFYVPDLILDLAMYDPEGKKT